MRFGRASVFVLVVVAAWLAAALARGQSLAPVLAKPYAFLPRQSTLEVSHPGLEIPDYLLPVYGRFDLAMYATPIAEFGPTARFTNVHAFAGNPLSATAVAPIDLDQALNLSGLIGRQLPVASLFDVFEFTGKNSDGSAVDLFASIQGKWLRLQGGTTPPSSQPHQVTYQLSALARLRPKADFNSDDQVDGHDLTTWMTSLGSTLPVATDDAAMEGPLTGADFLAWQQQLGETPPPTSAFDAAIVAAIANQSPTVSAAPEPSTLIVVLTGLASLMHRRRRLGPPARTGVRLCQKSDRTPS